MLDKSSPEPMDNEIAPAEQISKGTELSDAQELPASDEPKAKKERSLVMLIIRGVIQFVLMLAVLVGSFMFMQRMIDGREEPGTRSFTRQGFVVESTEVARADHRPTILVYGEVKTARNVDLRPLVSGEIVAVNPSLSAGARIEAGDLLIEVDRFDYEGAVLEAKANLVQAQASLREIDARLTSERAQLDSTKEQLALAKTDLERARLLVSSGTLTSKQLDDRVLIVSQREQSVSQRENNIVITEAQREQQVANISRLEWKLREVERQLEQTKLYAPFSGIVSNSDAEPGRSVSANDVVASIYDDQALEAAFTLTNAQYGRMSADSDPLIGRKIEVIWTIGAFDYSYTGTIDRIGATVAADRGGVEVVARIDPADHSVQLRPGAFVEIIVPDRLYANAIKVPETSIYDQSHIFIIEDGKMMRRDIDILAFDGSDAIVTEAQGTEMIKNGDRFMTTRLTQAADGAAVREPGAGGRPQGAPQGTGGRPQGSDANGRPGGPSGEAGGDGGGRPDRGGNGGRPSGENNQSSNQNSGANGG